MEFSPTKSRRNRTCGDFATLFLACFRIIDNGREAMTDMPSSGSAPSPVVCPLAKLGRLSPSVVRFPYATGGSPLASRRFKSTSSESLDYKSSQCDYLSNITCNGVGQNANTYSPQCRYRETGYDESPSVRRFYGAQKPEEGSFFQTALRCTSPYLDQGTYMRFDGIESI